MVRSRQRMGKASHAARSESSGASLPGASLGLAPGVKPLSLLLRPHVPPPSQPWWGQWWDGVWTHPKGPAPLQQAVGKKQQCGPTAASRYTAGTW